MPTTPIPMPDEVERFLLSLIATAEGRLLEEIRDEVLAYPDDSPWNSEQFVKFMFEIEQQYGIDFEPHEAERRSRGLSTMVAYIIELVAQAAAATA